MPNYTIANKFRFAMSTKEILGSNIDLNVVSTPLPSIAIGTIDYATPYKSVPIAGDSMEIGDVELTFILSEDMTEWKNLFKWLSLLKECKSEDIRNYVVDGNMMMLDNKSSVSFSVTYQGVFPYSMGQIQFQHGLTGAEELYLTANFKMKNIKIDDENDSLIGTNLRIVT